MVSAAPAVGHRFSRRQFLTLATSMPFAVAAKRANSAAPARIVTFDWGLTATALSLGANVVGLPSPEYYNLSTVEPVLPSDIADVGLLFTPSFEILDELHPDLIIIPPSLGYTTPMFERICETVIVDLSGDDADMIGTARVATEAMAERLSLVSAAKGLIAAYQEATTTTRAALSGLRNGSVLVGSFADDRHLTVYGRNTLFGNILGDLGLDNALDGVEADTGRSVIGVERLARVSDATFVLLANGGNNAVPENSAAGVFWQSLPAVRDKRVLEIGAVLEDGGLPAAIRFSRLLAAQANAR